MLKSYLGAALAIAAACLLAAAPGLALADGLLVRDASGTTRITCSITVTGTEVPCHIEEGFDGTTYRPIHLDTSGNLVLATGSNVIGHVVVDTAPTTPTGYTSTEAGGTVTTHGTFQQALASSGTRRGCLVINTSVDKLYVFFGSTGSATTSNAIPLQAGQTVSCAAGTIVLTDNVAVTSSTTDGAAFVVVSQ